jgi:hypothetical protein
MPLKRGDLKSASIRTLKKGSKIGLGKKLSKGKYSQGT